MSDNGNCKNDTFCRGNEAGLNDLYSQFMHEKI